MKMNLKKTNEMNEQNELKISVRFILFFPRQKFSEVKNDIVKLENKAAFTHQDSTWVSIVHLSIEQIFLITIMNVKTVIQCKMI